MCRLCLSRRSLLAVPVMVPLTHAGAAARDAAVEPRMRLADPAQDRLVVAVTLDACPGDFDARIATALVESGIPATIFATDLWLRRNPAGLALLLAHRDLFGIENHGELHIPPILGRRTIYGIPVAGDLATVRREVTAGAAAIDAVTGVAPRWYRAATGYYSPAAIPEIAAAWFRHRRLFAQRRCGRLAACPQRRRAHRQGDQRRRHRRAHQPAVPAQRAGGDRRDQGTAAPWRQLCPPRPAGHHGCCLRLNGSSHGSTILCQPAVRQSADGTR